jgi:hypothetical protein
MARSAAGRTIFLMVSLQGISSISATFYRSSQKRCYKERCHYTHLTNESIQKDLAQCMTMGMPFKRVDFTEGVEFLGTYKI